MPQDDHRKGWKRRKRSRLHTRLLRALCKADPDTHACAMALVKELNTRRDWYHHGEGVFVFEKFMINVGLISKKEN